MSFWRQFGREWDQIRRKFRHFLSKCPGNSMTWPCTKSMSCSSMEDKYNLDKWHGIVIEFGEGFGPNRHQVELWREMTWNSISMRIHVTFFTGIYYYLQLTTNLLEIEMLKHGEFSWGTRDLDFWCRIQTTKKSLVTKR